MRNCKVSKNVA